MKGGVRMEQVSQVNWGPRRHIKTNKGILKSVLKQKGSQGTDVKI